MGKHMKLWAGEIFFQSNSEFLFLHLKLIFAIPDTKR